MPSASFAASLVSLSAVSLPAISACPGLYFQIIDLFNVIVFIRVITRDYNVMPRDQKLWNAKTFPVPLIPMDSSQILLGK